MHALQTCDVFFGKEDVKSFSTVITAGPMKAFVYLIIVAAVSASALTLPSRRTFVRTSFVGIAGISAPKIATSAEDSKQLKLGNDALAEIIRDDLVNKQFLVNGKLTRYLSSWRNVC